MPQDHETLRSWVQVCLIVAAVCTTAFPVLWSFSRWWTTTLGRLLMLQAVSFAVAMDLTLFFQIYRVPPGHIHLVLWLESVVFGLISLSTLLLTGTMIRLNYMRHHRKKEDQDE